MQMKYDTLRAYSNTETKRTEISFRDEEGETGQKKMYERST